MDDIDRRLLELLQAAFPAVARPYAEVGARAGIDETEALRRIHLLYDSGVLRRIGVSVSPRALGWVTTLVAARVTAQDFERVTEAVNAYDEVTHNYEREGRYNMWFTLIARDRNRIERIVDQIRSESGVEELIELPATGMYKLDVRFKVNG